ncbi:MAG: YidC/Oxa1 family membrane protein insertase [Actinobacteria bacterium]|nr:YidC/Oxa1 family membrane protein insertase [Actinomycetota bacterium]
MYDRLSFIVDPLRSLLEGIHSSLGVSWAISIIILTIIVRIILIPLTVKQFTSMRAMQKLQPKIKELQAQYKDDKQKLNEEMMKFYKENKVNPFGSCLPLIIQMPIFISLYYMIKIHPFPDNNAFLWISGGDATQGINASSQLLVLFYMATQLFSSLLLTTAVDKSQKIMMILMPLGIGVFFLFGSFPAAVLIYWVTTNIWTIGQQLVVKRIIAIREAREEPMEVIAAPSVSAKLTETKPAAAKKTGGKGGGKSKKKRR